jgi:Effector Associated Constant Component 1
MVDEQMVTFELVSPDLGDEELDEEVRRLGSELREAGLDARVVADGGTVPAGAKSGDPVELIAAIAVALSTTALEEVIRYVWSWLKNRKRPQNVKLSVSGGNFDISSEMSSDQLSSLLAAIAAAQTASGAPAG